MIKVTRELLDRIRQHGEQSYPYECCGLLLGKMIEGTKELADLLPIANSREDEARHNRYLISPGEFLKAQRTARSRGLDIIGCYHSHPDHPARPSGFDLDHATFPWDSFIITAVERGKAIDLNSFVMVEDRSRFDSEEIVET
ncbi:MAG TPA: M67 family metallopeptidase [Blastocatellia bacterium]|nr:M67 family metallopeptidase [Blastocatellia bacterium]